MRLYRTLGLALAVAAGCGAMFLPNDKLPGREVGAAESSRVIGGGPVPACTTVTCGALCGNTNCYFSGTDQSVCNSNCKVYSKCAATP